MSNADLEPTLNQYGLRTSNEFERTLKNLRVLWRECIKLFFLLQAIASFEVGKLAKKWTRFAFEVNTENVTFYLNCREYGRQAVIRNPMMLEFDSASTLYIGQAGPLLEEPYEVCVLLKRIQFCKKKPSNSIISKQ